MRRSARSCLAAGDTRFAYLKRRARAAPIFPGAPSGDGAQAIRREVARLRAFVAAGGLLMIGPDAIGPDLIKGHADLRGLELLVEGGTPRHASPTSTTSRSSSRRAPAMTPAN